MDISKLNTTSAWNLLQSNENCEHLFQIILDYICIHFGALTHTNTAFLNLPETILLKVLSEADGFNVDEDELLDIIVNYLKFNQRDAPSSLEILSKIKPPYLSNKSIKKHQSFLGADLYSAWNQLRISDFSYRAAPKHPLRSQVEYEPRKFDNVCQRWNEAVIQNTTVKEVNPTINPRYIGVWRGGCSQKKIFAFTFSLEFESIGEVKDGEQQISGRIKWRMEHFSHKDPEQLELTDEFYRTYATRFQHREDEIFSGVYYPSSRVLCLTGKSIAIYPYEYHASRVIGLDCYRLRLSLDGKTITGVTKGSKNWDNPFDAATI